MDSDFAAENDSILTIHHAAVIIPAILGIAHAASAGLNARIGLQQSSVQIIEPNDRSSKGRKFGQILTTIICFIISFCLAVQFSLVPIDAITERISPKTILQFWMFLTFQISLTMFISRATGVITSSVRNVVGQSPRITIRINHVDDTDRRKAKFRLIIAILTALALNITALYTESHLLLSFASLSLYINIGYFPPFRSLSVRGLALYGLCVEIGLITLSATLAVLLVYFQTGTLIDETPSSSPFAEFGQTYPAFVAFLTPCWLRWQSVLISTCLRFDYEQFRLISGEPLPVYPLHSPSGDVLLPRRPPLKFRKPYFFVTLLSTILTMIGLSRFELDDLTFACLTAILAYPIACLTLGFTAIVRGEGKALWCYHERYVVEAGQILLPIVDDEIDSISEIEPFEVDIKA